MAFQSFGCLRHCTVSLFIQHTSTYVEKKQKTQSVLQIDRLSSKQKGCHRKEVVKVKCSETVLLKELRNSGRQVVNLTERLSVLQRSCIISREAFCDAEKLFPLQRGFLCCRKAVSLAERLSVM